MLVLHPSSRCDVCLDPYSWDDAAQSPHAIPCGHIFCKTCLAAVTPSSCPLCRKAFLPDRIKKLHVDKPENVDPGQEDETRETELLRSLSLSWGENTPQEDIEALTGEVTTFLENKADDVCIPLRKARDGILQYHKLQKKREKDRATLTTMNRLLKTTIERAEEEIKRSQSIEETLILERDQFKTQCSDCEIVIEKLKADLAKYQYTTNPLPKPPEPVPIDRYPVFARAAAAGLRSVSDPHVPLSPKHHTNGTSAEHNVNGVSTSTQPQEYVSPDPTVRAEIAARDRESAEQQQVEEAQRRERIAQRKQKQPLYNTHLYPTTEAESSGKRSDLIPGASPNQRVIPSSSAALSQGMNGWHQSNAPGSSSSVGESSSMLGAAAPAGAYVAGYARGYGYGYNYAPSMKTAVSHDSVSATVFPQPPQPVVADETPRVGLGLYVPASAITPNRHREAEESLLQPPQTAPASTTTPSSRTHGHHHRSSRSRRDSTTADGHVTDSTITLSSSSSGAHRSRRRSTRPGTSQNNPSTESLTPVATPASVAASDRESISSWGTVPSHQVPGSSGSSVADLGLHWFPPGTGARTSASSDSSRNPYSPFAPRQPTNRIESMSSGSAANSSVDATPRASDHARLTITDPLQTLSMLLETNASLGSRHARVIIEDRPRPSRHSTLPEHSTRSSIASARTDGQSQASGSSEEHHSRRRHRPRRGSTTTGILRVIDENAAPSAPPSAPPLAAPPAATSSGVVDEGYLSDAPQPANQSFGNALGLDLTEEPLASNLVISAPTPIVSTRNFLRSWSYDH